MTDKIINIGILGLGTVGTGVVKVLKKYDCLKIKKIAVRNTNKKRDVDIEGILTDNPFEITNDPDISIVVEVMGGTDPAFQLVTDAIRNGKHIVTANKELLAKRGPEIYELAREKNVAVLYEASVGGGIPIIMPMKQSLAANKITSMAGILNGTTNYILTKMEQENSEFADVLKEAQELGYAEPDPTSDVEGHDAAYKLSILASIAFGYRININDIYCEGISNITPVDIAYASELGYKIKLIAMASIKDDNKLDVRVHPALVSKTHPLASINGVTNALTVYGDAVGQVNFSGPGAGQMPTASAVVGDILAIVREMDMTVNVLPSMKCTHKLNATIVPIEDTVSKFYVRFNSLDQPGVIGHMGMSCGNHGVSLLGVIQKDMLLGGQARIILLTHEVKESALRAAIDEISLHFSTKQIANVIRVFR
ncbi:MAG: homoserine dehydrogenase [Cyanobacteriota bacterium]